MPPCSVSMRWAETSRAAVGVGLLQISVGDLDAGGKIGRGEHHQCDLAKLRRAKHDLALLEIFGEDLGRRLPDHYASFVGFVPSSNPVFAIVVVIDSAKGPNGDHGGTVAAPIFKNIAEPALRR